VGVTSDTLGDTPLMIEDNEGADDSNEESDAEKDGTAEVGTKADVTC